MKPKIKIFKNEACVTMERIALTGRYVILARDPIGNVLDKVRCANYRLAMEYWRALCKLAKAA
jgi:hypothetical protein